MKADPGAAELGARLIMLGGEFLGEADHCQQGRGRAVGIVLAGDRRAPEGDHRVADELVDRPAMFEDDVAHPVEIGVEQGRDPLRRKPWLSSVKPSMSVNSV